MFAPILPRPTIPICMLVRSLFNGTCIEKYYPIAEVMAPTKIWRNGAGKTCQRMRWSARAAVKFGRSQSVQAEASISRGSRQSRDSRLDSLHLVGVGSFATLSLTFLVSHHDEAFALA